MKTNRELIEAVYAAFNSREIETVLAFLSPDVDWPKAMEGTRAHGRDEVRAYWTLQWSTINPHVDPVRIHEDETGKTTVNVHQVVRDLAGTVLVDQMVQHVYSIESGLVTRMDIHPASE